MAVVAPFFLLGVLFCAFWGLVFVGFSLAWAHDPAGAVFWAILFSIPTLGVAWWGFVIMRWLADRDR